MRFIKRLVCHFKGHYWVYRSPHNTYYKICNKCGKTLRDYSKIYNGKLIDDDNFDRFYNQFGWNDIDEQ